MGVQILWAIVLGFLAGIFFRSFALLGLSFVGFLIVLAVTALLLSFALRRNHHGVVVAIGLLALGAGILRMDAAAIAPDPALTGKLDEQITLEGFVYEEPDIREESVRLSVKLESGVGVLMVVPAHVAVNYGDMVRAKGTLRLPESFETGLGREFNYPAYLAKDGIGYELSFAQVEVIGRGATNPIKSFAIWIKHAFLDGLGLALPEPHAGLAGGITVGDKRGVGEELSKVFRIVGLTHIIVLSGYNIMVVMEGLSRALLYFSASRYLRLLLTVFVALLFSFMTGLASASVRAALMTMIAVVGKMTGRSYMALRALAVVSVAMVAWNPFILGFDPGFQLSILATFGLIVFTPTIITKLRFIPTAFGLREIAATTFGAQLAVLPLLLYQNGQFSLFSLPANLLALVAVPFAMLFSAIAGLGGLVLGPLAPVIAFPAYALLTYILGIAEFFAALPFASVSLPAFSAWWLTVIYGIMILLVLKYERVRRTSKEG